MATLAQGQAARLDLKASQSITVTPSSTGRATVSANGPGNLVYTQKTIYAAETFGPYVADTVMSIAAVAGSLEYTDHYTLVPSYFLDASNNVTGLVGPAGNRLRLPDALNVLPNHLPILSPERHSAMSNIVVGGLTCSYQSGGERGRGMIRLSTAGAITSTALRLPLPLSAEYGTYAKAAGRVHFRIRCSDWSQVTRIYAGINAQGTTGASYWLLKMVESNITRVGATDTAQAAVWNDKWRTLVEHSDKKIVVGSPPAWDRTAKYFDTDGITFTITTAGAVNIDIDRIYSPDWPIGYVVNILDGAYKSARDLVLPEYNLRGWHCGMSGNLVDGTTSGVTTYPTLANLAAAAAQGHDVFMHGHYLSGATPTAMTGSVTEAETLEIMTAGRQAIAGAVGGIGARGLRWHQWLTNTGKYNGGDMAGLLKTMGVAGARGDCADATYGIDPWNAKNSTWSTSPASETGTDLCGYVSHRGAYNHIYSEWWDGTTNSPAGRDTYADSGTARALQYAATCGDGLVSYIHNVVPNDGTNPTSFDVGTLFWRDYLADMDAKVRAGTLLVLSPSELLSMTYARSGDVYLRWDGEWVNHSDGSIAF